MADYEVDVSKHANLAAMTVDVVKIRQSFKSVEIVNRSLEPLFFRIGQENPSVLGDNSLIVPGEASLIVSVRTLPVVVRLISAASCDYSVQGRA